MDVGAIDGFDGIESGCTNDELSVLILFCSLICDATLVRRASSIEEDENLLTLGRVFIPFDSIFIWSSLITFARFGNFKFHLLTHHSANCFEYWRSTLYTSFLFTRMAYDPRPMRKHFIFSKRSQYWRNTSFSSITSIFFKYSTNWRPFPNCWQKWQSLKLSLSPPKNLLLRILSINGFNAVAMRVRSLKCSTELSTDSANFVKGDPL